MSKHRTPSPARAYLYPRVIFASLLLGALAVASQTAGWL